MWVGMFIIKLQNMDGNLTTCPILVVLGRGRVDDYILQKYHRDLNDDFMKHPVVCEFMLYFDNEIALILF